MTVWFCHSNPNPRFKEKNNKSKKKKKKELNKETSIQASYIWHNSTIEQLLWIKIRERVEEKKRD